MKYEKAKQSNNKNENRKNKMKRNENKINNRISMQVLPWTGYYEFKSNCFLRQKGTSN